MTFNEYQTKAKETAVYPDYPHNIVYPALALAGEAGEVANKVKKYWCSHMTIDSVDINYAVAKEIMDELGDILWYVAAMCNELRTSMDVVATCNIGKLAIRKAENKLKER
jgi:NTP pyrophosphatase (non-canonical NTP hydrolase)